MNCNCDKEENFTEVYFIENYEGDTKEFCIRENRALMSVPEMINRIIRPLLKAYGYYDSSIDKWISEKT